MKNIFIFFISLLLLLFSCKDSRNVSSVKLTSGPSTGSEQQKNNKNNISSVSGSRYSEKNEEQPVPKVSVDPGLFLISVIQTNLDLDTEDEQILIYRKKSDKNTPISIAVVDFDTILNRYKISWSAETNAMDISSFNVSLMDVTGDHNLEIVCTGSINNSMQTINIFKRASMDNSYGLIAYKQILSMKENGNIEIQEIQRSQAYTTGVTNGKSFPVVATVNAMDKVKSFDLTRKTFYWRNEEDSYKLVKTEIIPGKVIENLKLRKLLTGTKRNFEEYLSALWILSSNGSDSLPGNPVVLFDPKNKKITFYRKDIQELYRWENSIKTLYNTLIINCRNDIIPYLRVTIYIRIIDLNTIRIIYKDDNIRNSKKATNKTWSGKYIKTNETMENYLFGYLPKNAASNDKIELTGYYKSDNGAELFFDPPKFQLKNQKGTFYGGFYLYQIGTDILQLRFMSEDKKFYKTETYKYDYLVKKDDLKIIRTLVLIPGKISVNGFEPTGEQFIRYEQIEQLDTGEVNSGKTQ